MEHTLHIGRGACVKDDVQWRSCYLELEIETFKRTLTCNMD